MANGTAIERSNKPITFDFSQMRSNPDHARVNAQWMGFGRSTSMTVTETGEPDEYGNPGKKRLTLASQDDWHASRLSVAMSGRVKHLEARTLAMSFSLSGDGDNPKVGFMNLIGFERRTQSLVHTDITNKTESVGLMWGGMGRAGGEGIAKQGFAGLLSASGEPVFAVITRSPTETYQATAFQGMGFMRSSFSQNTLYTEDGKTPLRVTTNSATMMVGAFRGSGIAGEGGVVQVSAGPFLTAIAGDPANFK